MDDDFNFENLTRALEGALPPASILSFIEIVRRLTPERRREVGRLIRGPSEWDDWLLGRVELISEHPPCEMLARESGSASAQPRPSLRGAKPIASFIDEMVELPIDDDKLDIYEENAVSAGFLASGRKKDALR